MGFNLSVYSVKNVAMSRNCNWRNQIAASELNSTTVYITVGNKWLFPPDCECTWCAGHVRPLCFPPHPACTQGWSQRWLAQISKETRHHWSLAPAYRRQPGTWLELHTSFRNLSIHLVVSIIRTVLSKMSIYDQTHMSVFVKLIEKHILWSCDKTYCRFKSLVSQKFNKMYYFAGCVNRVCDENTSCQRKEVKTNLQETLFRMVNRMFQWDLLHSFGRLMVFLISLVAGPGRAWWQGSTLTSYITSLDWTDPWRTLLRGVECFKFLWSKRIQEKSEM